MITYAKEVLQYLNDVLDLANSPNFEESAFQVYQSIGRSLVAKIAPRRGLEDLFARIAYELARRLDKMGAVWQLYSGFAMESLWSAFKPPTVRSASQLRFVRDVEGLADRFDELKWRSGASIAELLDTRNSLVGVFKSSEEIQESQDFVYVEQALEQLERRSMLVSTALRPHFAEQFAGLSQYESCEFTDPQRLGSVLTILSGQPTKIFMSLGSPSAHYSSLTNLPYVLGAPDPQAGLAIVRQVVPISILCRLAKVSEVPLRSLGLLAVEIPILGSSTARLSHSFSNGPLAHMVNCTKSLQELLSEELQANFNVDELQKAKRYLDYLPYRLHGKVVEPGILESRTPGEVQRSEQIHRSVMHCFSPGDSITNFWTNNEQDTIDHLAWDMIQFFIGFLVLYMPDRPFDPALTPKVERDRYTQQRLDLQNKLGALKQFEQSFSGQSTSFRIRLAEDALLLLGKVPEVEEVFRPSTSQLGQLQGDFNAILRSIVLLSPDQGIFTAAFAGDLSNIAEIELRQRDIQVAILRLSKDYRAYDDIVKPLVAMLQGLDVGYALALLASFKPSMTDHSIAYVFSTTPFMGCSRLDVLAISTSDIQCSNFRAFDARVHFLRTAATVKSFERKVPSEISQIIIHVFNTFYQEWKEKLDEDQRANAASSSLYRYHGGDDANDEALGKEFDRLFPDYEHTVYGADHEIESANIDPSKRAQQLATLQRDVFENPNTAAEKMVALLQNAADDVAYLWSQRSGQKICPVAAESMLSALFLKLDGLKDRMENPSKDLKRRNFYADPNLSQAQILIALIRKIETKFLELQERWPEHATLADVLRVCTELLAMRHTEPLAKLLSKAEQLHSYVNQWQIVASKEYSAVIHYNQLTQLLVNWRRLELSTWARLLDVEDEKCREDAESWWFVAYETIIAVPLSALESQEDVGQYTVQLFGTLEEFLASTSMGQYSCRLAMIQTFQAHVRLLSEHYPGIGVVQKALLNFHHYYRRYASTVQEVLLQGRQTLERELKEIVLLASWKDINIVALKASAKRSHHKLFKIVRKYRALLAQPMSSIIRDSLPETNCVSHASLQYEGLGAATADQRAISMCERHLKIWTSKPVRFTNPNATAQNMFHLSQPSPTALDGAIYLSSYAEGLLSNIKNLRKDTPSTATKDNMKTIKHLMAQKRKLFAGVLKDIRQMGFRSNLGTDLLAQQSSVATVLSKASSFDDFPLYSDLQAAEMETHNLLNVMPQIRDSSHKHHNDLSHGEIARSVGYIESMLSTITKQRKILACVAYGLSNLEETQRALANAWTPDDNRLERFSNEQPSIDNVVRTSRCLPSILDVGKIVIVKYDKLSGQDHSQLLENLRRKQSYFEDINRKIETLPALPTGLTSSLHRRVIAEVHSAIDSLGQQMQVWIEEHPHLAFVLKQIKPWAETHNDKHRQETKEVAFVDLHQFDSCISQALDSVLVAVQAIQSTLALIPNSDEDSKWILRLDAALAQTLHKLHVDSVVTKLKYAMAQIQNLDFSKHGEVECAGALCAMALPIVKTYYRIVGVAMERYAKLHLSLAKFATVLSKTFAHIRREGFCNPSESLGNEDGQTEKLTGGTGLGEGEGVEDISKDIQDDEDLSELAQQGQKEDSGEPIEDQEDAVNMDHDELEGETAKGVDRGEDDASGSEADEREVDDEIGSVNEADPSSVDEKLWDGKQNEPADDEQGSKAKTKSSIEEQTSAGLDQQIEDLEETDSDVQDGENQQGVKDAEIIAREDTETMEPYAQDGQNLDLPEEMDIGNADGSASESSSDADDMERLSDIDDARFDEAKDITNDIETDKEDEDIRDKNGNDLGDDDETQNEATCGSRDAADSPVDNELHDIEDRSDEGDLLQEHTDSAAADPDNTTSTDVKGLGQNTNPESQEDRSQGNNARGEQGAQGDSSSPPSEPAPTGQREQADGLSQGDGGQNEDSPPTEDPQRRAFKTLGDALKTWHRQQRQINDADHHAHEVDKLTDAQLQDQDLEHIPAEDIEADGQALGAATDEQALSLDKQALESERQPEKHYFPPDEASDQANEEPIIQEDEGMQEIHHDGRAKDSVQEQSIKGALVVNSDYDKDGSETIDSRFAEREENIEKLDKDLSATHLQPSERTPVRSIDEARQLWAYYEHATRDLSLFLTEQLRLILAPTLATKMRGDFRSGKRLNMKRVIPYIASQYKRDKIWMRRSIPSKRDYQIMLAVDDSKSMGESGSGQLAFETLALVAKSLSMLEVGQICVVGFGNEVVLAHEFDKPFSTEAGAQILSNFGFQQTQTNVSKLIAKSIMLFREARRASFNAGMDLWQLELIISDGVCEDHDVIRRLVRQAQEDRIMIVFVIVDSSHQGGSIINMTQAVFESDASGESKLGIKRYLDDFPFLYYLVVGDVKELPLVLAQALRQWFSEVVDTG